MINRTNPYTANKTNKSPNLLQNKKKCTILVQFILAVLARRSENLNLTIF